MPKTPETPPPDPNAILLRATWSRARRSAADVLTACAKADDEGLETVTIRLTDAFFLAGIVMGMADRNTGE